MPLPRALPLAALALVLPPTALAVDLDEVELVWSKVIQGTGGSTANDEAHGIAFAGDDSYLVAGWIDGAVDDADTAYLVKYDATGAVIWDLPVEAGPIDGVNKTASTDRFYDVAVGTNGNITLGGALSGPLGGPDTRFYVWHYDEDPITNGLLWTKEYTDGDNSPDQAVFGVALDAYNDAYASGWGYRNDTSARGRWVSWALWGTTGYAKSPAELTQNWVGNDFAVEQAQDVVVDSEGNMIVVGTLGVSGTSGDDADTDLHITKYGADFVIVWEYTWSGSSALLDGATAVTVDAGDEIVVVGYTNKGTDNGAGADYDWLMMQLPKDGPNDDAFGPTRWVATWESAPGANEQATSVSIGSDNIILVGGYWEDGGITAPRIMQVGTLDGLQEAEWLGPTTAGDSAITALVADRGRVATAGYEGNGTDRDFFTTILEVDSDGDGVPDSIDGCPADEDKTDPLICGCGEPEDDTDGDLTLDCVDVCPDNPEKDDDEGECGCDESEVDTDGDGTKDCIDNCPDDPNKISLGECGCGAPDDDSDGDGVLGCDDACSNTPAGLTVDEKGCPPDEGPGTGDGTGTGTGDGGGDGKCGCSSAAAPNHGALFLAALGLVLLRRRAR